MLFRLASGFLRSFMLSSAINIPVFKPLIISLGLKLFFQFGKIFLRLGNFFLFNQQLIVYYYFLKLI